MMFLLQSITVNDIQVIQEGLLKNVMLILNIIIFINIFIRIIFKKILKEKYIKLKQKNNLNNNFLIIDIYGDIVNINGNLIDFNNFNNNNNLLNKIDSSNDEESINGEDSTTKEYLDNDDIDNSTYASNDSNDSNNSNDSDDSDNSNNEDNENNKNKKDKNEEELLEHEKKLLEQEKQLEQELIEKAEQEKRNQWIRDNIIEDDRLVRELFDNLPEEHFWKFLFCFFALTIGGFIIAGATGVNTGKIRKDEEWYWPEDDKDLHDD